MSILTLTMNPCIDKSSSIENVVAERKLRCGTPRYEPGGGGINVSRAIHKLGGESTALCLAGGPMGQMLEMLLDQEGIQYDSQQIKGLTRENLIVHEKATKQQYRFGMPGPEVREEEWEQCLEKTSTASPVPEYIVASGSLPPGVPEDFYGLLARLAKGMNARLVLDTTGAPLRMAVDEGVYMMKPNLRELRALAEKEIDEESHQVALARRMVRKGQSEVVVVSLGPAGALLVWKDGCERVRAPTVPIESKVGAGDSMVGGMVLALNRGESLLDAVRFGVAAGAAAVMTPGTDLCRRDDAERLYRAMTLEGAS
jgi:6-phosphofructokinase 2